MMLLKAHLTLHFRMSDSRWVITPLWLSGSWRSFWCSSSVYSCHIFLISSASVRSIPFLSFVEPTFAWNIPLVSLIFLKRSLVFLILLFSSICADHWGRLSISPCYFLELCIQMGISVLFSFVFCFSSFTVTCKASSDSHCAFFAFLYMGMVLIPVSCTMSQTSVHSSSGTLSDLGLKSISNFHCIIIRDLI